VSTTSATSWCGLVSHTRAPRSAGLEFDGYDGSMLPQEAWEYRHETSDLDNFDVLSSRAPRLFAGSRLQKRCRPFLMNSCKYLWASAWDRLRCGASTAPLRDVPFILYGKQMFRETSGTRGGGGGGRARSCTKRGTGQLRMP